MLRYRAVVGELPGRLTPARVRVARDAERRRVQLELTQEDLTTYGVSERTVWGFLNLKSWPNGRSLRRISKALGWTDDELVRREAFYDSLPPFAQRWATDDRFRSRTALLLATQWRRRGLGEGDTVNGLPWSKIEPILAIADPNASPEEIIRLAAALGVPLDVEESHTQDLPRVTDL